MAKNRWYGESEDAFIRRRVRELGLLDQPYRRRRAVYQQIAQELAQQFGVTRSWQGIQQRIGLLVRCRRPSV